jgi:stalled ribosome rescue protein Dom34
MKKGVKKKSKRGFLMALLIGFDEKDIHAWKVYSHSIRHHRTIKFARKWKYLDDKQKYKAFEELVDLIRIVVREGLNSILLACSHNENYSKLFLEHVHKHHRWLVRSKGINPVSFGKIDGLANTWEEAKDLISREKPLEVIQETTLKEINQLVDYMNKVINIGDPNNLMIYDLKTIEDFIYEGGKRDTSVAQKLDFFVITENFINNHRNRNRVYRLIQIAKNKGVKTRIISEENPAVERFNQFGGILALKKEKPFI